MLADEWLLQLPLEALKTFAVPQITSISRDFSLQFHYHRVHPAERTGMKRCEDIRKELEGRHVEKYIRSSPRCCASGLCDDKQNPTLSQNQTE